MSKLADKLRYPDFPQVDFSRRTLIINNKAYEVLKANAPAGGKSWEDWKWFRRPDGKWEVQVSAEVYQTLEAAVRPGESHSDVFLRMVLGGRAKYN
jgi:hypothetical protein